ncbi:ALP1-like protein [Tanacetum coccineum]
MGAHNMIHEPTGLAQLTTKGVLGEVVTTCERSQVRVSSWGFSFKVGIYRVLPHRCVDSRLSGTTFWVCTVESNHLLLFEAGRDYLLALIVCTGNGKIVRKNGTGNLREVMGANNDITVLNNSPLFDDLLDDIVPVALFEVNRITFQQGYYLADGIYPQWSSFVKSFFVANSEKNALFKRKQESARKVVERAFRVLQGRWHIIYQLARQ